MSGPAVRRREPPPGGSGRLLMLFVLLGPGVLAVLLGSGGGRPAGRERPTPSAPFGGIKVPPSLERAYAAPRAPRAEPTPWARVVAEPPAEPPAFPVPSLGEPAPPAPEPFASVSTWRNGANGYRQADEERRRYGTAMAVYFHTDWCGWCRKMERDVLSAPETEAYLGSLARVKVNPEEGEEEAELARRHGVNGYPTFLVVPASGGGRRVHPFRTGGTMTPAQFVAACRAAEQGG